MTLLRTAGWVGTVSISAALLLAACGGSTPSATPGSAATGAPSAAPVATTAASTPAGSPAASVPAIAIPSFDISALTNNLANVDSYRVSISQNGAESVTGVVVTKPELSRDVTLKDGTRIVVIGDEAWVGRSGAPLTAVPGNLATTMFSAYDPTFLVAAFSGPQWAQSALDQGRETKNGVDATHYRIDPGTAVAGFSGIPAGASIDLWVSDAGILVALDTSGWPNGSMSIQVTNIDDPANKVERPS